MPSQDPSVKEWSSHLSKLNIELVQTDPIGDVQSQDKDNPSTKGLLTSMSRINNVLGDMAHDLKVICTTDVQEEDKKTPGWGKFDNTKNYVSLFCFLRW